MLASDTIAALATPPGESAIAVVRVSGPLATDIAVALNRNRPPPPRQITRGHYVALNGGLIDDVLFIFFRGPASYTGDNVVEISCHGNPYIVRRLLEDLHARGCRQAEPGEFTKRAFLAGKLDLTRAEAVMEVVRARSDRALDAAQRQLRGELGKRIDGLVDRLLRISASIEAYIDFPEDDLPTENRHARLVEVCALLDELRLLHQSRRHSDLLRDGAKVVLFGGPNVGKSSLLNRIVGYERAIVSEVPGTTRDYLEEGVLVGPHRILIKDTAGLQTSSEGVEAVGIKRALQQIRQADIHVLVLEAGQPLPEIPPEVAACIRFESTLPVVNKVDLPHHGPDQYPGLNRPVIRVSALTGLGLDALRLALIETLDRMTGTGAWDEGVALNLRHAEALESACSYLGRVHSLLDTSEPLELAASELRGAICELGRIVGRIDNEAVLDRLFAEFCIGK